MATASDQLARLLALVPWLKAHPNVKKAEAAAAFGISVPQLEADLRLAFTCEVPGRPDVFIDIDYLDSDRVAVIDAQSIDRPLRLRPDEVVAVLAGLRTLAAVAGLQERSALDSALAKLEEAVGGAVPQAADRPRVSGGTVDTVRQALEEHRRLHLRYWVPARDEVTERDVDPARLLSVDGVAYLEGWCHRSEALRTFRLDRVVDALALDIPAEPPVQGRDDDLLFHPNPDDTLASLSLSSEDRWIPEYYPCESAVDQPDGGMIVTLRSPDTRWLRRLVLRLGGRARVLAPDELAADVRREAASALAAYDSATPLAVS